MNAWRLPRVWRRTLAVALGLAIGRLIALELPEGKTIPAKAGVMLFLAGAAFALVVFVFILED